MKTGFKLTVIIMGFLLSQNMASQEIILPFSGKEYKSDKNYMRVIQSGKSPNISQAKKIAMQNARTEMAGLLESQIAEITRQYTVELDVNQCLDYVQLFEQLSVSISRQTLANLNIMDEKTMKDGNNTEYWVVLELPKTVLKEIAEHKIEEMTDQETITATSSNKNTEKTKLKVDKEKFMKIFDAKIEKLDGQ